MTQKRPKSGIARIAAAFTVGATAGSLLALLFAPASGRVTRQRVAMKLREVQRAASGKLGKGITQARSWVLDHISNGHARRPVRSHHA